MSRMMLSDLPVGCFFTAVNKAGKKYLYKVLGVNAPDSGTLHIYNVDLVVSSHVGQWWFDAREVTRVEQGCA